MTEREDTGMVELAGRHWLTSQLLRAGLEVAQPERDRGIDLIVYLDLDEGVGDFLACPIQMKAATDEPFSVQRKYERFRRLLLVYVVNLGDSTRTAAYAMTYPEAAQIVYAMGIETQGS